MTSGYWDRYGRAASVCHRLPPAVKLLITLAVVIGGLFIPPNLWPLFGVLASLVFLLHTMARIPIRYLARRVLLFLPVALAVSLSIPISQGFVAGCDKMAAILFRSTLSFLAVLWLVNVLPFDQLLVALRRYRVPAVFVAMLAFMYRYSFVLWDELNRMRTARKARQFQRHGRFGWGNAMQVIGLLLIRSMERAERVHGAMCSRGWDGQVRSLSAVRDDIPESPVPQESGR